MIQNIRRCFFASAVLLSLCMPVVAQKNDARAILDAAASKIKNSGGTKATFQIAQFSSGKQQWHSKGVFYSKGGKFFLDTDQQKMWFDGRTLWTYQTATSEVNVETPQKSRLQQINPYAFIGIYKQGYRMSMSKSTVNGQLCNEVHLLATARNSIPEIYISVSQSTKLPVCVRVRQGNDHWTRISIRSFQGKQRYADSFFRFNPKDYPKTDVVDLR